MLDLYSNLMLENRPKIWRTCVCMFGAGGAGGAFESLTVRVVHICLSFQPAFLSDFLVGQ